jgi:hypothetical protein
MPSLPSENQNTSSLRGLSGLLGVDLLPILVVPNSRRRGTVSAAFSRTHTHDLAVDSAADAVLQLEVHLGNGVVGEDGSVRDITCSIEDVLDLGLCKGMVVFRIQARFAGQVDIRIAADSTMFLMVNLFMALSLGVQREQFEHRMGLTCWN